MIGFLRAIGIINVAIWFGGSLFYTLAIAPAFIGPAPELKRVLGEIYSGLVGNIVAERYYLLQNWCGSIGLVHLLAEWVYLSRPLHRLTVGALVSVFVLGLMGGMWFQPRINQWHQVAYGRAELFTATQKMEAARSLAIWQGLSGMARYLSLAGLLIYGWRLANPSAATRFTPTSKFRS